ncbi:hypothetical protein [Polyangium sp. 6x1]|uniref:hypothetical protein n=1 Tax=Polyangium sp. 6x1 TaxID=3042689 RepID=UPI002482C6C9|nr:hypothetical protein [Polyangium sp. 6x1]MDI1442497.1 hypothetical protein [Polyangium sp. 6x1]
MRLTTQLSFDLSIFSAPVVWRPRASVSWLIAFVSGAEDADHNKFTAIDVYAPHGEPAPGFPALRRRPYLVAPAAQVGVADWDMDGAPELLVVDLDGRIASFRIPGSEPEFIPLRTPIHGLLAAPPQLVRCAQTGLNRILLLSHNFTIGTGSRDAIGIFDRTGQQRQGYPISLQESPASHPPIFDSAQEKLFVLMSSGRVHAFDVNSGRPISGFPNEPPPEPPFEDRAWLALFQPLDALIMSTGTDRLVRIDTLTGKQVPVAFARNSCLTGLVTVGDFLYVVDEANGVLLRLDKRLQICGSLQLGWSSCTWNHSLRVAMLAGPSHGSRRPGLIIVSCSCVDLAAMIGQLFTQHATNDVKRDIEQTAENEAMLIFGTLELNSAQRQEIDHSIVMMKKAHLANVLGEGVLTALLACNNVTRVQVVRDEGECLTLMLEDVVKDYRPAPDFMLTHAVAPVAVQDGPLGLAEHLVMPLNEAPRVYGYDRAPRSRINIYSLHY